MTVPATARRAGPFNGNGTTTSFPFDFKLFDDADLEVFRADVDGVETALILNSDYSVTLNVDQDVVPGGQILYPIVGTPLLVGETLTAISSLPYDQVTDLPTGGAYRAQVVENTFDRIAMQIQQLVELSERSLVLSPSTDTDISTQLPPPDAFHVIGWNETEDALINYNPTDFASQIAAGTAIADLFSGDGTTTTFLLSSDPGKLANLDVSISGVTQRPGIEYTWAAGTRDLVFTTPPAVGVNNILARYMQALPQGFDGDLRGDLANTVAPLKGDALVGVKQPFTGAVARTQHDKNADVVSVKDFGAKGDGVADDTAAIQAAVTAVSALFFPPGTYKISSPIAISRHSMYLLGAGWESSIIRGTHAGVIFQFQNGGIGGASAPTLRDMMFRGTGCTGIGCNDAGGTVAVYLDQANLQNLNFGWELAYGINADCIFLTMDRCNFGLTGDGIKPGTMVCLRSTSILALSTNLNAVRNCRFYNSTGTIGAASAPAVVLTGGGVWKFDACNWEQAGQAIACDNISYLSFTDCWFEALAASVAIVDIANSLSKTEFRRCNFVNVSPAISIIQWNSTASPGLVIDNCFLALTSTFVLHDNSTGSTGLDGAGKIEWTNNLVTGGSASMTTQTATRRDGNNAAKGWAVITTSAGAPVTVASSEPLTFGRNGVGDININLTHPAATTAARVLTQATPQGTAKQAIASGVVSGSNIRVLLFDAVGAAVEDTFSITWGGS